MVEIADLLIDAPQLWWSGIRPLSPGSTFGMALAPRQPQTSLISEIGNVEEKKLLSFESFRPVHPT